MTMNLEEKLNKNVRWVINELQSELIVSDGDIIRYFFIREEGAPSEREQRWAIKWLTNKARAVELLNDILEETSIFTFHPLMKRATIGFKLKIDRPIFVALSKIYEGTIEGKDAARVLREAEMLGKSKQLQTEKEQKQQVINKPFLDEESRSVIFSGKKSQIPIGNQWILCQELFKKPAGDWVKENDVVNYFTRGDNKQSFYDASRTLNKRIKKDLGIADFIEYDIATARISPEAIEKLNQSEK